ncbi:MAG TPA: radical SAM protein [Elusimicrobiota bacterium]|nr:radical SAM protein [Elusimicrobiota bacterium]
MSKTPSRPKSTFDWYLTNACNYRCAYCWHSHEWPEILKKNKVVSRDVLRKRWTSVFEKQGPVHVQIAGGEPTTYPDFLGIMEDLCRHHTVWICTNLSQPLSFWEDCIRRIPARSFGLTASFHPDSAKEGEFLGKVRRLVGNDYGVEVVTVAWPPFLADLDRRKRLFGECASFGNFKFRVQPFTGDYEGRRYPEAYSADEKKLIRAANEELNEFHQSQTSYLLREKKVDGRRCWAGTCYVNIDADGSVYRCNSDHRILLGNFLDGDLHLSPEPQWCDKGTCTCEWRWIVGEDGDSESDEKERVHGR